MSQATAAPRRSRENTRARLVEAAADVFAEKPLRRVTVDDLVAAAGFTRGAFYSNFQAIDEVFFEVFAQQADLMLAAVREVVDESTEDEFTLESLRAVLEALTPFGRRWYLIQHEFALLAVRDEGARQVFTQEAHRLQGSIEELVGRVLRLLGREPVVPLPELTDVLLALYLHSLGNQQLGTGTLNPEHLVADVLPQVIIGLSREADRG